MTSLFSRLLHRRPQLVLVAATRDAAALAALAAQSAVDGVFRVEVREAFSTAGVYQVLPGAHLIVLDEDELVETGGVSRAQLLAVLAEERVTRIDGRQFAADPASWLETARAALGVPAALPPLTAALIGLSGGVGKTTLALDTAAFCQRRLGLPVAVLELSLGPSGLAAVLGGTQWPHLYELVTQGVPAPQWRGVTLAPMDWDTARLLAPEQAAAYLQQLAGRHVLTLVEGHAAHPFWPLLRSSCRVVLAVADGRPDALAGAAHLIENDRAVGLVLNRAGVLGRLGALNQRASLPAVPAPERFEGRLGRQLMPVLYPGWRGRKER